MYFCTTLIIYSVFLLNLVKSQESSESCGPNEEHSNCTAQACESCEVKLFPGIYLCARGACIQGCQCKENLYRNWDGECVTAKECESQVCYGDKVYNSCSFRNDCSKTCEEPNREEYCKQRTSKCLPACECPQGTLPFGRTFFTRCIPESQCKCKDPNAQYQYCPGRCTGETCEKPVVQCPVGSDSDCSPVQGCDCKRGFLKNANQTCSPLSQCASRPDFAICKDKFKTYSPTKVLVAACDVREPFEMSGCVCKQGLWFASRKNQTCIPKEYCQPTKCGSNEVWSACRNHECQIDCQTFELPTICYPSCTPGCVCDEGFYRNKAGKCVTPDQCDIPLCSDREHQEYNSCPTCQNYCFSANETCYYTCFPRCSCKTGFYRGYNGECVPYPECDKTLCSGPHEVPSDCPNYECGNTCAEPNREQNCTSDTACEYKGCVCEQGYLRDTTNNECVPEEDCYCEDPNSTPVSCLSPCPGGTCELPERQNCNLPCKSRGCECKPGFLKNLQGKCVTGEECKKY